MQTMITKNESSYKIENINVTPSSHKNCSFSITLMKKKHGKT